MCVCRTLIRCRKGHHIALHCNRSFLESIMYQVWAPERHMHAAAAASRIIGVTSIAVAYAMAGGFNSRRAGDGSSHLIRRSSLSILMHACSSAVRFLNPWWRCRDGWMHGCRRSMHTGGMLRAGAGRSRCCSRSRQRAYACVVHIALMAGPFGTCLMCTYACRPAWKDNTTTRILIWRENGMIHWLFFRNNEGKNNDMDFLRI